MTQREEIAGAVARGWCHPANAYKVMDEQLALAIIDEVLVALAQKEAQQEIDNRAVLEQALEALDCATTSIRSFWMDEGCGQVDFDNMDTCLAAIAAIRAELT